MKTKHGARNQKGEHGSKDVLLSLEKDANAAASDKEGSLTYFPLSSSTLIFSS